MGLRRLPDVSTVSRALSAADQHSVDNVRAMLRQGVSERLGQEGMARITVDFDGSVQSTTGHAEGTAVGFNKVKKGARSYYPLFATIAQTGQFWDMHHRPGNVHDSNGAAQFMRACLRGVKEASPTSRLESRTDAAFFSEEILTELDSLDVDFSCTLPFERFPELKGIIQRRRSWSDIDDEWSFCQLPWRPKSWSEGFRVLVFRHRVKKQQKGPLQLDLFVPVEKEFEYKATVTNKPQKADSVLWFHNGRGAQEKIFGEAKQNVALDLIATHTRAGNQLFTLAGMFAHNLNRELQMQTQLRDRHAQPKRPTLWDFLQLGTIRQRLLHVAGQLTRPQGELTLTVNDHATLNKELLHYLQPSQRAA